MSSTVKSLTVTYNPVNEKNTFRCGDTVSGEVRLEVVKECTADSLSIKFKGKAEVLWTERHGQTTVTYYSKDKYFSVKHYFVGEQKEDDSETPLTYQNGETYPSVVTPGIHVYPFTFQFPLQEMPSSFKGAYGKIVYLLEAKLSRSMRIPTKGSAKLKFVSKADLSSVPEMMTPQHEHKDKNLKFFNSGTVGMDVDIDKTGYFPGEKLKVSACIENNSSREIKPKYCLYSKHIFLARGRRKVATTDLLKEVGEPIAPSATEKVTRVLTLPKDLDPSILNCSNIEAGYKLKVYLDVKYASDPKIKFPITILPASEGPAVGPPPSAPGGFGSEAFGGYNPPVFDIVPPTPQQQAAAPQPLDPPPPYGAHGMYPPMAGFGNNYLG